MLISLFARKDRLIVLPKATDLFYFFLFLFFFTLHADQLSLTLGTATLRVNNLLAAFLFFALLFRLRLALFSFDRKLLISLSFLTLSFFLSTLLSPYRFRCFLFFGWYLFTVLFYFFLPYFLIVHLDEKRVLKLYFLSFLVSGIYGALQLAISFLGIHDPFAGQWISDWHISRPNGFAYEPSYFALYLTPFIVMANLHYFLKPGQDFFLFHSMTTTKILFINLLYIATTSTGAIFAYVIFLFVVLLSPFRNNIPSLRRFFSRFSMALGGGTIVLLFLFPYAAQEFFFKFFYRGFMTHHSFFQRWCGIENGFKLFLQHPLFGVGPGGMPLFFFEKWQENNPSFFFPVINQYGFQGSNPVKLFEPSNVFMEILGSLGVAGVLAFLVFLWAYYRKTKEVILNEAESEEKRHWVLLFFLSTVVTMIVLQFNQGLFRTYIWTHLAMGFALTTKQDALHTREPSSQDPL